VQTYITENNLQESKFVFIWNHVLDQWFLMALPVKNLGFSRRNTDVFSKCWIDQLQCTGSQ